MVQLVRGLLQESLVMGSDPLAGLAGKVRYTPQMTDICVCCRHVDNVSPTRQRHSVKLAFYFADKVVSSDRILDTLFYLYVGIGTKHFWYVPCLPCMHKLDFFVAKNIIL